jgi:hypothetical protein
MADGRSFTAQALLKQNGRKLDRITLADDSSLYFDVTDIYDMMHRSFGSGKSPDFLN